MKKFEPKFCPKCGNKFIKRLVHDRQRLICPKCGYIFYDNPIPAVGAIIIKDGKILCTRRAFYPFVGEWDLPGGFLEGDEEPIGGLKREIKEETGLEIEPIRIIGAYQDKYHHESGETSSVTSIFYLTKIKGGKIQVADDISKIKFFPLDKLPAFPFPHYEKMLKDLKKIL